MNKAQTMGVGAARGTRGLPAVRNSQMEEEGDWFKLW